MRCVLLLRCADQPGLVAAVGQTVATLGGNILHADQHTDRVHGLFLQRVEADFPDGTDIASAIRPVATAYEMDWQLHDTTGAPARLAVLVSKQGHCLADLLARIELGELAAEVAVVVSNHTDHLHLAERAGIDTRHLPVDPDDGSRQPGQMAEMLDDVAPDLIVLARYMRILPSSIVDAFENRIINIHHSFLPAFVGARPYHQAYERGVKVIGATAHYASSQLDEGPIILQDVRPVSHRHEVEDLIRIGADLERTVLARSVRLHLEHRVMAYGNRTVVFD